MIATMITPYFLMAVFNLSMALFVMLFPGRRVNSLLWSTLLASWSLQLLCHLVQAGPYSLSSVASTCTIGAIVLTFCQRLSLKEDAPTRRPLFSALLLVLLALASMVADPVRHDSFMMTYIFAILFFLSRPVSLGLTLYALAGMAHLLTGTHRDKRVRHTAKDAAFFASILFLGGEIVGCYWGFMGWGTTWRWSGNFHFSAMLFVLFMVSLHVPPKRFKSLRSYDMVCALPLLIIALCMVLSKVIS